MTSAVLNVSNKFGFLNISDSEDEGGWQKPKKSATAAKKGEGIYQDRQNTYPWLADNQSRDLNNEFWLVVNFIRSVPEFQLYYYPRSRSEEEGH